VEDFTELGLKDMQDKYIRTPLEPAVTFGDDACRVIRSIRFSHRFGFKIADEIKQTAIENIQIREQIRDKISEERSGTELDKILDGKNAAHACEDMYQVNLLPLLYKVPTDVI